MKAKKVIAITGISLGALLAVSCLGFLAWVKIASYPAFPEARAIAAEADRGHGWYSFMPLKPSGRGLVFYPGALVAPSAYAPLMKAISERGILVVVVPMPLGLAVFGIDSANEVIKAHPEIEMWTIAGHSLGGAMAAQYLASNPGKVKAIVFLSAYPAGGTDLSGSGIPALSLYGDHDLSPASVFSGARSLLPPDARFVLIQGANHAQFGNYGPQKGDGTATISREEQQGRAMEEISAFILAL